METRGIAQGRVVIVENIIIFMVEKNEFFAIKINNSFLRMKNKMNLKCSNLVMVKVNRRF